ncbi:MAG TPA: hypothetical protein VLF66_17040 [Thermoanaerobaculia bacterium]|nr:hypothetical protein [Thermoanaerobaculia bacterium]
MEGKKDAQVLGERKKALEEQFFARQEKELRERVRREAESKARRQALAEASGIRDEAVLDHLASLDLDGETVAALSLVPLVEVAWADGTLHDNEREAVLRAARESGVAPDTAAGALLESWLETRPDAELLTAWEGYVEALVAGLDGAERQALRHELLDRARAVAESAGGFLGMGKVSDAETAMLARLERAFA